MIRNMIPNVIPKLLISFLLVFIFLISSNIFNLNQTQTSSQRHCLMVPVLFFSIKNYSLSKELEGKKISLEQAIEIIDQKNSNAKKKK